jgi:fructose-1,6-bisphosphatase II
LWPRDDAERALAISLGYDVDKVLSNDDLCAGDNCFFAATGITDGELLKGVHFDATGAHTESLVMRSRTGTVRTVYAHHRLVKLAEISGIEY